MSDLLRMMGALARAANLPCRCLPYEDAGLCECGGECGCHKTGGALFVGEGGAVEVEGGEIEYAEVPTSPILAPGSRYPVRYVRCYRCNDQLRVGDKRAVVKDGRGWRCGTVLREGCRTGDRVVKDEEIERVWRRAAEVSRGS